MPRVKLYIAPNIRCVIGDLFIQTIGLITEIPVGGRGNTPLVPLKKLIMLAPEKDIQFFGTLRINLTITNERQCLEAPCMLILTNHMAIEFVDLTTITFFYKLGNNNC